MKKKNIGSTFDNWLREEALYEKVSAAAIKRVVACRIEAATSEVTRPAFHGPADVESGA
jgi:hypothetical protein